MPSATKTCGYCHQDCSTKPRLKDEAGNYFCKECFPLAKAAKPGAPKTAGVAAGASNSVFDDPIVPTPDLLPSKDEPKHVVKKAAAEEEATKNCASCGVMMPRKAVVCTNCGFNSNSQKAVKTKIQKAEVVKGKKGGGKSNQIMLLLGMLVLLAAVAGGAWYFFMREQ